MKKKTSPAAALLEAHVAYVVETLCGDGLDPLIEGLLDQVLAAAAKLELEEAVSRELIKATARTWAVEMELRGGIPELVGEAARALHGHPVHTRTKLGQLMTDARFKDLLDCLLSLKSARRRLVTEVVTSPLYERFASDLLYNGIRDYLEHNPLTQGIPGARSAFKLGKAMVSRAASAAGYEGAMEDGIKRYIGRSIGPISQASVRSLIDGDNDDSLREAALESWLKLKAKRLSDWRDELSPLEVEELFVTLFEFWKELRATPFLGALIDAGVDAVFDKYGQATLKELLDDFDITRERMRAEAQRFAPPVLQTLQSRGLIEPLVRAALEGFYRSGRVEALLK